MTLGLAFGWLAVCLRMFSIYRLHTLTGSIWAVADDVYISASFARSWIEGEGLLWYAGAPRVEGYTNPLWVLLLAPLHLIPGFDEDKLGLYVACMNVLVMMTLAFVFVRAVAYSGVRLAWTAPKILLALSLTLSATVTLGFCVAAGFETGLVALLAFTAFAESLRPAAALRLNLIAVLIGLAFWTRMDALVYCSAALVMLARKVRWERKVLCAATLLIALVSAQFAWRRWYYGDWLPNTYYLKATGWPIRDRLAQGFAWSGVPLALLALVIAPGMFVLRRRLSRIAVPLSAALLAYLFALLYSIELGGDFVYRYGQNRFTCVGAVFLSFALVCGVLELELRRVQMWICSLLACVVSTGPLWIMQNDTAATLANFVDLRRAPLQPDLLVNIWSSDGKWLREIAQPGARIAACGVGAVTYFSHRGGVDLLGKVEPLVARQPVRTEASPDIRCWRRFPGAGHNKEDVPLVFAQRRPEISLVLPPAAAAADYQKARFNMLELWALRGTPYLRWDKVIVEP